MEQVHDDANNSRNMNVRFGYCKNAITTEEEAKQMDKPKFGTIQLNSPTNSKVETED